MLPALASPAEVSAARAPYAEVQVGVDRVALLKDGHQAYPAMLAAIAAARRTVCLETYILKDDDVGTRFLAALEARARAGVQVLLMYDFWGSEVSEVALRALAAAGVKVLVFKPLRFTGSLSRYLVKLRRRNHRKALVVDGEVAFTGGLNISRDYASPEDGGEGWRDTHLRVVGPAAQALERLFLATWRKQRGPALDEARLARALAAPGTGVRVVGNDFDADRKGIRRAYLEAFDAATSRIFLTHAYFLPPAKVLRSLVRAAHRGVRVAVILAATTDVKVVLYAARGLYPRLIKNGIEVYEWKARRVLHAKTATVDGAWSTVGSSNLDPLSLRQNLEVNAIVEDRAFAGAVERLFLEDLAHCERVTLEQVRGVGLLARALSWLAFRFRHWL